MSTKVLYCAQCNAMTLHNTYVRRSAKGNSYDLKRCKRCKNAARMSDDE